MSADNCILIGKFPDGYRIADNVSASDYKHFTPTEVAEIFKPEIYDLETAYDKAGELYGNDYYEHGIIQVEYNFEFPINNKSEGTIEEWIAQSMKEWKEQDKQYKKKYPIRSWCLRTYQNIWYPTYRFFDSIYDWFRYRIKRYHNIYTGLKPSWYDRDHLLLVASFTILKDFVEKEKPFEYINWNSDEENKKARIEIEALYNWWTKEYPAREKVLEDLYSQIDKTNYNSQKNKAAYDELNRLEEVWHKKEQENLHRLIEIRSYLWT